MTPEVHYAKCGEVHIAYQVFGEGAIDLVVVPGFISHIEHYWEEPGPARRVSAMCSAVDPHMSQRLELTSIEPKKGNAHPLSYKYVHIIQSVKIDT